ncbi:MAG: DUF3177 domain-containing protein [Cyanobacteria bacterium QH_8_48_120]|jgi:hypothetical protein|nr:MAG: DUF3177 domain-containing protein [Cyanobacteria bacterium QH_1_48_107]PSO60040.1 MAG: DUF3177 domain-containing protein [Cyanobacteria bacterium QH_2_48_84]PSO63522.1 MAG: DUF3177 domain-containing protein [Cyanobacteria bacterium QH_6_48_35]PSO75115.1 MAG: DUF3177 domain-containing protein [Cyanobacteria bacterium QH_8_48_120]
MQEETWLRALAWTDYRLAVLFTVIIPLILLIWAFIKRADVIQHLLIIYWRVASLLLITLYLMIPQWSIGFLSGWVARILIPISLWFWVDLNEEINDQRRRPLKLAFTAWRWAVTIYCALGVLVTIPFWRCTFSEGAIKTPFCRAWLELPQRYKEIFHPDSEPGFLGFLAIMGLIVYVIYIGYFVLIRLGKQGRSAMEQ